MLQTHFLINAWVFSNGSKLLLHCWHLFGLLLLKGIRLFQQGTYGVRPQPNAWRKYHFLRHFNGDYLGKSSLNTCFFSGIC
jgi:hypothetical protein